MSQPQNFKTPEENDLQKILGLLIKNLRLFIFFVFIFLSPLLPVLVGLDFSVKFESHRQNHMMLSGQVR